MDTKLVVRLLDADNQLLGSAVHFAQVKGDGCLRASGPVVIPVERAGFPVWLSVHWCDVNVETRVPAYADTVRPGHVVPVYNTGEPMMVVGQMPGPLPSITVGQAVIGVPTGGLGVTGNR